jgi:threonine dehydratase
MSKDEAAISFDQIVAARERIAGGVYETPCIESIALSELLGAQVFVKQEYLQRTGSFKERGARNALLLLEETTRKRGVICASAGNHALAVAYHGRSLGIAVAVVMPHFAPLIKQDRCRQMGARVILHGENILQARARADEIVAGEGLHYIHGFDDPAVIAGQGTIGLEVMDAVPEPSAILVPVGGAGLIAGVALAVQTLQPKTEIIGVEADYCASFKAALLTGAPVEVEIKPTLADGLAVPRVGARAFEVARHRVKRVVTVSEEEIALSILRLAELEKGVVEGAGAVPVAAMISGKLDDLRGKRVVLLLCGGNIDPTILSRVIEHGLVVDGRLTQFRAVISDRPGGLAELTQAIASVGASIKEIDHERAFSGANVFTVQVLVTVETHDFDHVRRLHEALTKQGITIISKT